jgi:hypothetical protein
VEKEDLDVLPYRILPININQQQFHLALRLLKENQNLSQYLKISEALRIPKTLEKVNFNDFEIVKQFQFNKWSPIDKGSYISEEDLKKVTSFTSERYNNLLRDKIVIAEDALTITATFDNNKHVPQGGVYFGVLKNENISLKYILALLNSKLLSFVYNVLFSGMHMGGGYLRYRTEFLEQLPIMPASEDQQQDVIKLADKMLSLNQQLRTVNVDFDRYLTEPIMGYINFKDYYKRLDVKDKEALEKASTGSVKRVKVEEQDSWLMFKVDYFIRKGKIKEEFIEVPILRCRFEDVYWKKFLLYVFQNYKKRWGSGNLLSIILNTTIPCFDKNPDRNNQIIKRIMEEFLKAVEEKERLEKEINQTDNTIDSKVYELYGLTSEEIALVENHKN